VRPIFVCHFEYVIFFCTLFVYNFETECVADRSLILIQVLRMRERSESSPFVSLQMPSFDSRAVHVGFLVAKVNSRQVFLKLLLCTMPFFILLILLVHIRSFTIEASYFYNLQIVQTSSGSHLAFYSVAIESSSPDCEVA